ncbi:DUF2207 domain-containing protein [Desertihabitans brevis]|uniref:DUF2207 domain-containing protein n=1 Tax=Desertihabitans brevis TaxID=2268447 RepID=A0A367YZT4_9ACTN|nr:DUF2207 domain-containing protein [Desertihabitans brevis]RCK71380.1 DUF2207 domain-containing protein [Desertihabitans brevis]
MRATRSTVLMLLAAVLLLLLPTASARAESDGDWSYPRYDVTAELAEDGTAQVTLDFDYDLGSDPGHGPLLGQAVRTEVQGDPDHYRSLPITDVTATRDGRPEPVQTETDGGVLQLRIGDEDVELEGLHTYTVTFTQRGLVNPEAAGSGLDELAWNVLVDQSLPVQDVTVTVTGPDDVQQVACFAGDAGSRTPCATSSADGPIATFGHPAVEEGQGLTTVAGWPAGTFTAEPILIPRRHLGNLFPLTPVTGVLGSLVAVLGVVGLVLLGRRGADERYADLTPGLMPVGGEPVRTTRGRSGAPVAVRFTPPEDARPGQIGTLLDEVAHDRDVTATIVDLAVRGHLVIEDVAAEAEKPPKGPDRWRLRRLDADRSGLQRYEQDLLDGLFADGSPVLLSDLGASFATLKAKAQRDLYRDVTERGWFHGDPSRVRATWVGWGILVAVAGAVLSLVLAFAVSWGLVPLALVPLGIALAVLSVRMPTRTAEGSAVLEQARGFKLYLGTAEADQIRLEEGEDIFSRYLPHAIAFGVAEHWAGVFRELAERGVVLPDPVWYVGGYHGSLLLAPSFASDLASFSADTSAAMTAASTASSGGSGFSAGVGGGVGGGSAGGW